MIELIDSLPINDNSIFELNVKSYFLNLDVDGQIEYLQQDLYFKKIFGIFEVKNVQLLLNISCEKNNELFNLQVEPKIKSTLPKITKKERIYLSIGVGTFSIICGLLFPFPANLISLITVPIIIEQIKYIRK